MSIQVRIFNLILQLSYLSKLPTVNVLSQSDIHSDSRDKSIRKFLACGRCCRDDNVMNIAVSHLTLNFLGGEENLCLSLVAALKRGGHRVTLFTVERTDWDSVRKFFGSITLPDEEIYATSSMMHQEFLKASTLALAYAHFLAGLIRLNRDKRYGLTINSYGDLINSVADLTYVHFPIRATLDYSQTPAFVSPLKWKAYCRIYTLAATVLDKVKPGILLTNSEFTKQVAQEYLKRELLILHPPVDVDAFASSKTQKEDYVITVSKFTPKRALYRVPLIAKNTRNAKFLIAGGPTHIHQTPSTASKQCSKIMASKIVLLSYQTCQDPD